MRPILIGLASNAPLYYLEDQIPKEPTFSEEDNANVGIGTRSTFHIGGTKVEGCVVAGIHHYPAKVGYDLYVPDGPPHVNEGQHYTLISNIDSVNVEHVRVKHSIQHGF